MQSLHSRNLQLRANSLHSSFQVDSSIRGWLMHEHTGARLYYCFCQLHTFSVSDDEVWITMYARALTPKPIAAAAM